MICYNCAGTGKSECSVNNVCDGIYNVLYCNKCYGLGHLPNEEDINYAMGNREDISTEISNTDLLRMCKDLCERCSHLESLVTKLDNSITTLEVAVRVNSTTPKEAISCEDLVELISKTKKVVKKGVNKNDNKE